MMLAEAWTIEARAIEPLPAPTSYQEFASTIILPDGRGKHGRYHPSSHPAQQAILMALDGGCYFAPYPFREIAIAKPVQDGGSLVSLVPLLRRVIQQRQAALVAFPSLDSAKDVWTTKISPILKAYGGQEPESGGGSKGGAARVITLPNGGRFLLRAAGGRGESQQASVTGDALCVDEVDDWPDLHRIELITKRLEEAGDPLLILVCTVKRKLPEQSLILVLVQEGTGSRLVYRCPDCGTYQRMLWSQVRYERAGQGCVGGTARVLCINAACGSLWDERTRLEALRTWLVVHRGQTVDGDQVCGPIPETPRFGLTWDRLESPRKTLASLCQAHARAQWYADDQHDYGPMRSFYQDYMTQQFEEPKASDVPDQISVTYLMDRAREHGWAASVRDTDRVEAGGDRYYSRHIAPMPPGADAGFMTVDVQGDRCYWLLMAADAHARTWDVGWGYEHFDRKRSEMNRAELHAVLDRIDQLAKGIAGDIIEGLGVDANYRTDDIVEWLKSHRAWWPVFGASASKAARMQRSGRKIRDVPGILYLRRTDDWRLHQDRCHVDTNPMRLAAQSGFLIAAGEPGSALLPSGLLPVATDMAYPQHLCGELMDQKTGGWSKPKGGGRHDWLDCRTYAVALMRYWLAGLSAKSDDPPAEEAPATTPWIEPYTSGSGWTLT